MELRLVVDAAPTSRELVVQVAAEHTAADLATAINKHIGAPADAPLCLARTGAALASETTVAACGLRAGDRLTTDAPPRQEVAELELGVIGGPASGTVRSLPPGAHTVGRSRSADIKVDDPFISREHARLEVGPDGVTIADLGSSNGIIVDGRKVAVEEFPVGVLAQVGSSLLRVRRRPAAASGPAAWHGVVPFNRPPRVARPLRDEPVELPAPPPAPGKRRLPLVASLLPLLAAVFMAQTSGNSAYLVFAALSPIMALWSWFDDRRSGRKEHRKLVDRWRAQLDEAGEELARAVAEEERERRARAPDAVDLLDRARGVRADLWERRPGDPDFLSVRVGWGDALCLRQLVIADGGDDVLRERAAEVSDAHATVSSVPIVVPLAEHGPLGIVGEPEAVHGAGRAVVAGLAGLHSPRDVVLAVMAHPDVEDAWAWATWLPHVRSASSPIEGPQAVAALPDAVALIEALLGVVRQRTVKRAGRDEVFSPAIVAVIDGSLALPRVTVSDLLRDGPAVGVHAVWLGREAADLPGECRSVLTLDEGTGTFDLVTTTNGRTSHGLGADGLPPEVATDFGRALAPIRDVTARGELSAVPRRAPLLEVLELEPEADGILGRWSRSRDLGTTIGATGKGPLEIDIRRDGPHALVGGTTGSGKSELLQSLVAGLALDHPPDRCTFLLVDYKGGAAFKDCVTLPHTVGFVTDLDGHLVHRALTSLNAELKYREHVLHEHDAKDLIELESRDPAAAPPNLIIVVDEFATLAKELPGFVEGVVDVAQRGRSLGIHLVLATQRPAGSINDNIRANTNLRIALRMNDVADSQDVLNDAAAAGISRSIPGRGYVRMGPSELVEFQSAYVGGHTASEDADRHVVVHDLHFGRRVESSRSMITADLQLDARTDLERIVDAAAEAFERTGRARPRPPWLPPLAAQVDLAQLPPPQVAGRQLVVGVTDEPRAQRQGAWTIDLDDAAGILVVGSNGSGSSTFLRTLAVAAATTATPDDIHVYGLDFGGGALDPLRELPHVGSVIAGDDVASVQKLFRLLDRTIEERRSRFASVGVSNIVEYTRVTGDPPPRILLLLDGYAAFSATFEGVDYGELLDHLPRLASDGQAAGVMVVVTAERAGAVPLALQSALPTVLVLRLADPDEYSMFGLPRELVQGAAPPDGRAFLRDGREVQLAIPGTDAAGEVIAATIRSTGRELAARYPDARPPAIRQLPEEIARSSLPPATDPMRPVVGLGGDDVEPVHLDLGDRHALIVGPGRSGRSTALATLARSIAEADGGDVDLVLLAPRRTPLTELTDVWSEVAVGVDGCEEQVDALLSGPPGEGRLVLVVDDADELSDTGAEHALATLVKRGREQGITVLAACETDALHRAYGGFLADLRKERQGVLLSPDPVTDSELLDIPLPRSLPRSQPPGRGYLTTNGVVAEVQVAR